jgi:enoyl-CoA hydratase/carnithine racemase
MSDHSTLRIERNGPVATVTLHRPDSLNALTRTLLVELGDSLEDFVDDDTVRVVVLTGSGRAFSAGVDLKDLSDMTLKNGNVGDVLDGPARRVLELLTTMQQLVVAKVNGFCFTGALELVLACDLTVTADEARFADTHAKFGLRPSWGMSQRLIRTVGPTRAREISFTSRAFSGIEAADWGIAMRSVPLSELDATVHALVAQLLENSGGSLAAYKDLYRTALDMGLDEGLRYEAATGYEIADTSARIETFRK